MEGEEIDLFCIFSTVTFVSVVPAGDRGKDRKPGFFHSRPIFAGIAHDPNHTAGKCSSPMSLLTASASAQLPGASHQPYAWLPLSCGTGENVKKEGQVSSSSVWKEDIICYQCFNCCVLVAWATGYFCPIATECMGDHILCCTLSVPQMQLYNPMVHLTQSKLSTSYLALVFYRSLNLSLLK